MDRVPRARIDDTDREFECPSCGRSTTMRVLEDARQYDYRDGRWWPREQADIAALDPPLAPAIYSCRHCDWRGELPDA